MIFILNFLDEKTLKVPLSDDAFLIKFLRATKYDAKKSYQIIKNYFTFKRNNKDLEIDVNSVSVKNVFEREVIQILPNRDKNGRRVVVLNVGSEYVGCF